MLRADVFVAATGVKPNLEPLAGTGVAAEVGRRWSTTACAPTCPTSTPPATWPRRCDRMTGERYVHAIFPNAVEQGQIAACNLLGSDVALRRAPSR